MMNEMMQVMAKKKKKMMPKPDHSQYDDLGYWTKVPKKKKDKNFFGHMKVQSLF